MHQEERDMRQKGRGGAATSLHQVCFQKKRLCTPWKGLIVLSRRVPGISEQNSMNTVHRIRSYSDNDITQLEESPEPHPKKDGKMKRSLGKILQLLSSFHVFQRPEGVAWPVQSGPNNPE